jgi:hypothetical protein
MVVDEHGKFLTQRSIPSMALISVEMRPAHLVVTAAGMDELLVPLRPDSGRTQRVQVWDDSLDAIDTGEEAALWFTKMLSRQCRLVFMPDRTERFVNPKYVSQRTAVSFADAFPFLLISQASLDDLNARLAEPVAMNRFRPNLVVTGCGPFEEDTWNNLKAGTVRFRVAKPCSRCTVPTVNQETGIRTSEPILTLGSYRTMNGKIYFGQNLTHEGNGLLTVGDEISPTPA